MRLKIYANIKDLFGNFIMCFWLSLLWYVNQLTYLMLLAVLKSIDQKKFNQKSYLGKNLALTFAYFYYGHVS